MNDERGSSGSPGSTPSYTPCYKRATHNRNPATNMGRTRWQDGQNGQKWAEWAAPVGWQPDRPSGDEGKSITFDPPWPRLLAVGPSVGPCVGPWAVASIKLRSRSFYSLYSFHSPTPFALFDLLVPSVRLMASLLWLVLALPCCGGCGCRYCL